MLGLVVIATLGDAYSTALPAMIRVQLKTSIYFRNCGRATGAFVLRSFVRFWLRKISDIILLLTEEKVFATEIVEISVLLYR